MTKYLFAIIFLIVSVQLKAQHIGKYQFTKEIDHPFTPYKMQGATGTCWSFSTLSFWESELLRKGKGKHDLAEMFVVRNVYMDKAENYILRQGKARFSQGGLAHDVLNAVAKYGIVPQEIYNQFNTKDGAYDHSVLFKELSQYVDSVVLNLKKQRIDWRLGVNKLLDKHFGVLPANFEYNGKKYTPISYAEELGLKPADYITVTSFKHHPYYSSFVLEVPDNWSNGLHYNLPLNELMEVLDEALLKGYTLEWDTDSHGNNFSNTLGLAVEPTVSTANMKKEDIDQFLSSAVHEEKEITPAYRQQLFEDYTVTDDHLMHITGRAKTQNGSVFYVVKNSSGDGLRPVKGYIYASKAYMELYTISFTLHKDALPAHIAKKLALK